MKARAGLVVIMAFGTVLTAGRLLAQGTENDPWSLSATLSGQYSDNRDGLKSNKESNVDVALAPRADVRLRNGERSLLDLFITPSVVWHSNPRSDSSGAPQDDTELFFSGGFDGMHQFSPRLVVKGGDVVAYNDDNSPTISGTGERQNSSHWLNTGHAGVDAGISEKVAVSVAGSAVTKRYTDNTVAQNQDENTYQTEADLKYLMGSGFSVMALAGWSEFDAKSSGANARDRGAQVTSVGLGVERAMSPDIMGRISGGYQYAEYDSQDLDSSDTLNGNLSLVLRAASPTRIRLEAAYGYYMPNVSPYSIQTLTGCSGAIEHDFLANLTFTLRGQYSEGDYEAEGDQKGGTDKLTSGGISARYRINRNVSVTAGYTHESWDSTLRESFERNTVDAGVTAAL